MVGSLVHQLTEGVCPEELEKAGLGAYYTDHGVDVYPQSAAGNPPVYESDNVRRPLHRDGAAALLRRRKNKYSPAAAAIPSGSCSYRRSDSQPSPRPQWT